MLTLVTAGSSPITLSEAKAHLRVDHAEDDAVIGGLLASAVAYVGEAAGRCLSATDFRLDLAAVAGDLVLPYPPVSEVSGIAIYAPDGTDTDLDVNDYYLFSADDRAVLRPKSGAWPATQVRDDAIRIDFTAGYAAIPAALRNAVLMVLKRDYDGMTGAEAESCDRAVSALVALHRVGWVAA